MSLQNAILRWDFYCARGIQRLTIDCSIPWPLAWSMKAFTDDLGKIGVPTVEVHISNIHEREAWRAESRIGPACVKTVYGRGISGYEWAIRHLHHRTVGRSVLTASRVSAPKGNMERNRGNH